MDHVLAVYKLTRELPSEELYGLTSQLRRAAVSIATNIAEGYGRRSTNDYARFLRLAKGSANEVETLLIVTERLGFVTSTDSLQEETAKIGSMLTNLIKAIEGNVVREIEAGYGDWDEHALDED
jgi:four helix bundle protein